jgi:hypothetical protein
MTFREKLADWISGGALTRAREIDEMMEQSRVRWRDLAFDCTASVKNLEHALRLIEAEEKPTSNATVKRMARIAREALE